MELLQRATNPWGQEILVRISWNLLWIALIASVLFLAFHFLLRRRWLGRDEPESSAPAGLPEKVERHSLVSRLFHGVMALSMFVLLFTGFLPVVGVQFSWVSIHWITGIVLIASVVFHVFHALVRRSLLDIWVGPRDIRDWWRGLSRALGSSGPGPGKPGKYPVENKLYHHAIVVTGLAAIATGLLMMVRVQTPFLERNPYLLEDSTWGLVYVVHGLASVALVGLVIVHVYFAILPEKRWITRSMIYGWIGRGNYLRHHDPERWILGRGDSSEPSGTRD